MEQGGAAPRVVLRGELYKASQHLSQVLGEKFNLRWFELFADGTLQWSDKEGMPAKNAISLIDAIIVLEPLEEEPSGGPAYFGLRITPINRTINPQQTYRFRASSEEERRLWFECMDAVANPEAPAFAAGSAGRTVLVPAPTAEQRLGIDIVSEPWSSCVVVNKAIDNAAQSGLLVGDTIVAVDGTVVRTLQLAQKAFGRAPPSGQVLLRLAGWNREVRLIKQAGISGITLSATPDGFAGVLVSAVTRDSAAAAAGLHVGDRVLAVNGTRCAKAMQVDGTPLEAHEMASALIRASLQEVKVVVSGSSIQVDIRKDADGRLGVGFAHGPPPRGLMGAVITDVMPRGPAHSAGLRNGDLLVSVDGKLVSNQRNGITLLSAAARALTCVVWRPRPQEDSDEKASLASSKASSATASGSTHNRDPQAASGAGAVVAVGMVPYAYYVHGIDRSMPVMPPDVPLYQDLTSG